MKTVGLSLTALLIVLTGSASIAATTLPPRYLSVPHFQTCLATQEHDGYKAWCMPAKRPAQCPTKRWHQLLSLSASDAVASCQASTKSH